MRYGGGSYADYYDWQTNSDIQSCIWGSPYGSFTGAPTPYDTTAPFVGARRGTPPVPRRPRATQPAPRPWLLRMP
jgi:hypothetical protein